MAAPRCETLITGMLKALSKPRFAAHSTTLDCKSKFETFGPRD